MLTALFIIAFIWFMWKVIALAVKMTWGFFKDWFLYYIFADRSHWTFPGRADLYSLADLDHWRYHSPCNIKIRNQV